GLRRPAQGCRPRLPWVSPQRVPNPEGVASSSPALPSAATLGKAAKGPQPRRGCGRAALFRIRTQPFPGCDLFLPFTQRSRRRQTWAGRRNPFGVETQNSELSTQHSALRTQDSELRTQHSGLNHSALSRSWSQPASKGHAHSHNFFGSFQHTVAPRGLQKTGSGHYPQPLTALLLNENYVPLTRIQPASAQDNVSFQQPLLRP